MRNLFTRLYLQFLSTFLAAILLIGSAIYFYAQQKLDAFAHERLAPVAELANQTWQTLSVSDQDNWLAIMSALSGTSWERLDAVSLPTPYQLNERELDSSSVVAQFNLSKTSTIQVTIADWPQWETGLGWLILNDLSNVSADLREARFQQLKRVSPFQLDRLNRQTQPLSALELRQLSNGQVVRQVHANKNQAMLYFPAGASQVIRMGPIPVFELFSNAQWILIVLASLVCLSLLFSYWVRPVQQRFLQLHRAVGKIGTTPETVQLPSEFDDQFGDLSKRIEKLASNLIQQLETNKQLNIAVSHDLKTPLARIKFALALVEEAENNPYLVQINQDVSLLSDLISELLLYHQLSESRGSQAQCEGRSILAEQLNALPAALSLIDSTPESFKVPTSTADFRRLIQNLLDNAAQYAKATVAVTVNQTNEHFVLIVEDDGPGLTPEEFERLKQPFQRSSDHRTQNQANHGLGLALIAATVTHYEGTLQCAQGSLMGAKFIVTLPYKVGTL